MLKKSSSQSVLNFRSVFALMRIFSSTQLCAEEASYEKDTCWTWCSGKLFDDADPTNPEMGLNNRLFKHLPKVKVQIFLSLGIGHHC